MRLAVALAACLLAVGPGWADELPHQDNKLAVETVAHIAAIERFCPEYRADRAKPATFQRYRGLKPGTVHPVFDDIYDREMRAVVAARRKAPGDFCMYAWATYGDSGPDPHLIARRLR